MNIFYNNTSLNDTLIGNNGLDENHTSIKKINDNILFLKEDKIIAFNIFNISNKYQLEYGRLLLNDKVKKIIQTELNISLDVKDNFFKVGSIIECLPISGTHLNLCNVDIKTEILQIVCGAKNVTKNMKVVVATIGAIMNDGMIIKKGNIKNNDSFGMLCSLKELGITGDFNNEGIISLNDKYKIGDIFYDMFISPS